MVQGTTSYFRVRPTGDGGIYVNADMNFETTARIFNVNAYNNTVSGRNVYVGSDGRLGYLSSGLKFKTDIYKHDFREKGLLALEPVSYLYRGNIDPSKKRRYGVIADQALEVGLEELVGFSRDGEVETFDYEGLTVAVLQMAQKLHARVTVLEEKIVELGG